ncbi:hypothetical protein AWM68_19795 [Fictibacillus phosphorivorans]|uniref:PBSX phage terminase small subunit-like N-terminal domain-containing protein n=1 Tax=Fictibacillus phosphorivorans TaxID=1221500 RepID=A0A163RKS4_9BACL|nr:phage terminase small subunit [Fictibacillus phosphorivorans]KZE67036.1 hypothetical protein AWM68_19795 [Fictibacillus phosphorivorans]
MARARSPSRDKAFELWKESGGKRLLKDIAAELDVTDTQVRKWKNQDKWDEQLKGNVTIPKRNVTNKSNTPKKPGGQAGNKGNPNPKHKFPNHNSIATKHGLFSKFLHEEQIEIIEVMSNLDIADQIWFQIEIKFSAIVRMQKIMWVNDDNDHLKEESGSSWADGGGSESFKVSFAYERYESYIKAQARAMAEYRNLVKQFLDLAHDEDERRLKLEQMRLGIEKTKAEIDNMNDDENDAPIEIVIKRKGERS